VTVRRGAGLTFEVPLSRAVIQVPTVKWGMIPGGVAYLRIIQFTPHTENKIREAVDFFNSRKYSRLIVDLRSNPGGLLGSVVDAVDLFFDDGEIVSTRSRIAKENVVYTARPGVIVPPTLPMVVLIDNGSASASEIFAGVMKDRSRATLFGTKTYGKGSVQQVHHLALGGFRLTMSRYYTPSGVTIDKVGVSPDREVKDPDLTEAELAAYSKIISERRIADFAAGAQDPGPKRIDAFIADLVREEPLLSERILRRMVRNEINRHLTNPPVYDLETDTVLQEAVRFLSGGAQ